MKKISVIIPCYNHASSIGKCLDGIFGQTHSDLEVIVVDDGSTDDLASALKPYIGKIQLIRQENRGGPSARNRGFKESTGELVIFCDADILWKKDAFAKMVAALAQHPEVAYAYGSFKFGWKTFSLWPFDATRLKQRNYIHTGSLIRRGRFPGFDETLKRFQDWDLWLTMLERGDIGVWVPEVLCRVIIKGAGISSWLPKIAYSLPWAKLGWRPKRVADYERAAEVIRMKHRLS